jgi:hypothetical protein
MPLSDGAGQPIQYRLFHQGRRQWLHASTTLVGAGVVTGDILALTGSGAAPNVAVSSGGHSQAVLQGASRVIALDNYKETELTLGRYDVRTGESPDVDLSEEPNGNTVSRSHALLRRQGDRWLLESLQTKNPTCINGKSLAPGQRHLLEQNDVITLGGVKLIFGH